MKHYKQFNDGRSFHPPALQGRVVGIRWEAKIHRGNNNLEENENKTKDNFYARRVHLALGTGFPSRWTSWQSLNTGAYMSYW